MLLVGDVMHPGAETGLRRKGCLRSNLSSLPAYIEYEVLSSQDIACRATQTDFRPPQSAAPLSPDGNRGVASCERVFKVLFASKCLPVFKVNHEWKVRHVAHA